MKRLLLIFLLVTLIHTGCGYSSAADKHEKFEALQETIDTPKILIDQKDTIKSKKDSLKLTEKEVLVKEYKKREEKVEQQLEQLQEQQSLIDSLLEKKKK